MKAQTKALVASVVVIALALTAVSGVTYSWFSDSESTDVTIELASFDLKTTVGDPTYVGIATATKDSEGNISILGLAANTNIIIPYTAQYKSNINVVCRTTVTVTSTGTGTLTDYDLENIMIDGKALSTASGSSTPSLSMTISDWIQLSPASDYSDIPGLSSVAITTPLTYGDVNSSTGKYILPDGSDYPGDWSPSASKAIKMVLKTEIFQGDYPISSIDSTGTASIPVNKVVSGDAAVEGSAKNASVTVDFSKVGTVSSSSGTVGDAVGKKVVVKSTTGSSFATSVGAIDLKLMDGDTEVSGANFDEPVVVTAVFKNVASDPGVVQVMYGSTPVTTISYSYNVSAQTLTVVFETDHFSEFVVLPVVASVDGTFYPSLDEAIKAVKSADGKITLVKGATAVLSSYVANEDSARNVKIIGDGTQVVDVITNAVSAEGGMLSYQRGSAFAFENVTIKAGEGNYDGIVCNELKFDNCTITGKLTLFGKSTFTGCTFNNTMKDQYSVWTYGAGDAATFKDCVFNTNGKAVLIYNEGAVQNGKVFFDGCTFNTTKNAGKSAIEIDTRFSNVEVSINGCSLNGDWSKGTVSGEQLWNNKTGNALKISVDGADIEIKKVGFIYGETDSSSVEYLEASKMSTVLANESIEAIVFADSKTWDLSAFSSFQDVVFEISEGKTPTLKNTPAGWTYRFYGEGYTGYGVLSSQTQYRGGYFEVASAAGFENVNKDYDAINEKLQAFMPYKYNLQYLETYDVKLVADLDFGNKTMDSIDFRYASIDGQNHIIKNANVKAVVVDRISGKPAQGGFVCSAGKISNISFDNIHVACDLSNAWVGIAAGYSNGTIENVSVSDSSITIGDKVTGCYAGGLLGNSYAHMKNCSVKNVIISGGKSAGSLVGYVAHENAEVAQEISGNRISKVTIKTEERPETVDAIFGRVNAVNGTIAISGTTISNIVVNSVTYNQADLNSTLYGDLITGSTGKITIDGAVVAPSSS